MYVRNFGWIRNLVLIGAIIKSGKNFYAFFRNGIISRQIDSQVNLCLHDYLPFFHYLSQAVRIAYILKLTP